MIHRRFHCPAIDPKMWNIHRIHKRHAKKKTSCTLEFLGFLISHLPRGSMLGRKEAARIRNRAAENSRPGVCQGNYPPYRRFSTAIRVALGPLSLSFFSPGSSILASFCSCGQLYSFSDESRSNLIEDVHSLRLAVYLSTTFRFYSHSAHRLRRHCSPRLLIAGEYVPSRLRFAASQWRAAVWRSWPGPGRNHV